MKKINLSLIAILSLLSQNSVAVNNTATGENKVYIEQAGNTNTITIQQVGGTNNVGGINGTPTVSAADHITTYTPDVPSSSNYAYINGSTNIININQLGNNNWAQYNIKGGNNSYTSTITGNNNQTKLKLGDTNTNDLRNIISETFSGNNNLHIQTLLGNDITSTLTATGNDNQITQDMKSTNAVSNISITGNNNILFSEQIDVAGAIGHNLKEVIIGSYNSISTQQQGSNDTTIDIKNTGDHNTITVRTSSTAIVNSQTAIAR